MKLYNEVPKCIKSVYNKLQDDESRMVFNGRLQYFLDGNLNLFIKNIVCPVHTKQKLDKVIAELKIKKAKGNTIICWGAGMFGKNMNAILNYYNLNPDCFCDADAEKKQLASVKVITPDELFSNYREPVVIITTFRYLDEIRKKLLFGGFKSNNIYDQFAVAERNSDEDYWTHNFIHPVPDEVYIDGGVLDCETIKSFIKFTKGKHSKIYGFEPDPLSYEQCLSIIERDKLMRVKMINKGLWSETTTLRFNNTNDGGACIDDNGKNIINVSTIDESVGDDRVTFIKLDVEGAELEALKGAKETIRRDKPRLAICVYHKPEDILELPLYLLEVMPEYKFFLRHETPGIGQTVLYAFID